VQSPRQIIFHGARLTSFISKEKESSCGHSLALGEGTMIILLAASSLYMSGLQAAIAAPTTAFRGCLREAVAKAKTEKVGADAIDSYLKNACTAQMGTLREALIAFRIKNGMSRKEADSDAAMTVNDYISTPADNYKFMAKEQAKVDAAATTGNAAPAAVATPKPVVTPAAAPATAASQPPKH
jgi:hypothetical protein